MKTVSKRTYNATMKRDGGRCVLCKTQIALQLHHINGRSETLTDDPDNCVMLCAECHALVHERNFMYRPYLNKYVKRMKERGKQ